MKRCIRCRHEKPLTEFSPATNNKTGVRGICKECRRIRPIRITAAGILKQCLGCEKYLPLDAYARHPKGRRGRQARCRSCKSAKPPLRRTGSGEITKRCSYCWTWKPLSHFSPQPRGRCGRASRCRPCRRLTTYQFIRPPGIARRSSKYRRRPETAP